jgi:hypothetical protein
MHRILVEEKCWISEQRFLQGPGLFTSAMDSWAMSRRQVRNGFGAHGHFRRSSQVKTRLLHLARGAVGNIARLVRFRPGAVKRPSRTHGDAAIPPRASLERGVPPKEVRLLREARKQAAGDESVAREM